jgi:transposase-like protein
VACKWSAKYTRLTGWVEDNIDETLSFYRLPRQHHKHLKSTNMLERLNEEIKRRTRVVRIFPNAQSCLRLVRALAIETHENWLEQHRYLNMDDLREHKKGGAAAGGMIALPRPGPVWRRARRRQDRFAPPSAVAFGPS